MTFPGWTRSELEYGRRVLHSGIEGARSGREAFLRGQPLTPFLNDSLRNALKSASLGACLGVLGSFPGSRGEDAARALRFGFVGGVIGLSAGVLWETRRLFASVASSAMRNVERMRDEHWLEQHPIDYA